MTRLTWVNWVARVIWGTRVGSFTWVNWVTRWTRVTRVTWVRN